MARRAVRDGGALEFQGEKHEKRTCSCGRLQCSSRLRRPVALILLAGGGGTVVHLAVFKMSSQGVVLFFSGPPYFRTVSK